MGTTKKLIELDEQTILTLKKQAQLENRSLKNYIENHLKNRAYELMEPSEEYKKMMDEKLAQLENGTLQTIPWDEIKNEYGLPDRVSK